MTVVPFPLGVADPSRDLAAIVAPDDTIECFRLSDGTTRWRVARPLWPRAIGDTRLLAQLLGGPNNVLSLAVLSLEDGRELAACDPVPLPWWSGPDVAVEAAANGDDFFVEWLAERQYHGGAPPPRAIVADDGQRVTGIIEIDGETGATTVSRDRPPREVTEARVDTATFGARTYALAGAGLEAREGGRVVWAKSWEAQPPSSPVPPTAPR